MVGHPILQESADDILGALDGVQMSVMEIHPERQTKLANLLWHKFPSFHNAVLRRRPRTPEERKDVLASFYIHGVNDDPVLIGLFDYSFPTTDGTPPAIMYSGTMINLEVISLGRNYIHHAFHYVEVLSFFLSFPCIFFVSFYLQHLDRVVVFINPSTACLLAGYERFRNKACGDETPFRLLHQHRVFVAAHAGR